MTMNREPEHLSDYVAMLRRRKRQLIWPAVLVLVASASLAFFLPPVYRSTATILIEQPEISSDLVASTVTGYAAERIQVIMKQSMAGQNLLQMAEKFDLFPKERRAGDTVNVVERMRKNIRVEMVDADINDPKRNTSSRATIAFEVSYDAETPEVAQKVARELTALLLNENVKMRTARAVGTTEFLGEEAGKLSRRIAQLEAMLAEFKVKNTGRLPELMTMNMSLMERTQQELDVVERQTTTLEERKLELQSQFGQVEPYTGKSPQARLRELQTEYLSASSIHSASHPDVVRMQRELESLKKEVGVIDDRSVLENEYKKVRANLDAAKQRYAPDHPDVVRLQTKLETLQEKLRKTSASSKLGFISKPDNPAYISLQTQLDTIDLNLNAAKNTRARLKEKLAEYESRIVQTPRVEQEKLELQREYDNAIKKFQELKGKELSANVSQQLEMERLSGQLTVIDAPGLPQTPVKPNRLGILLLGFVLSVGMGIGSASLAEYMDRTVRGAKMVAQVTGSLPLAVIPDLAHEKAT